MSLARIGSIEGFEQLVSSLGGNPLTLMSAVGLRQSQFRDPNTYVSYGRLARLLELAATRLNEPLFGLLLADRQSTGVLGDISLTLAQQPTLGDALKTIDRYLYLHARGASVDLAEVGTDRRVELRIQLGNEGQIFQLMQMSVGQLANFVEEMAGLSRVRFPVLLRQQAPPEGSRHPGRASLSRLLFAAPVDGVQFPQGWLGRRPHYSEEEVRRHFQDHLLRIQQRYPDNLADQVRDIIGRALPSGECSIEGVAGTLDLHPRTLQKRLKSGQMSYQQLLRETRLAIAEQHLRYKSMSVTDLALNLGYSDVAVFSRNFRQWTGMSPRQWQAAHAGTPPAL